jgi:hypothetical protein
MGRVEGVDRDNDEEKPAIVSRRHDMPGLAEISSPRRECAAWKETAPQEFTGMGV